MLTLFRAVRALIFGAGFVTLWGWIALSVRRYDPRLGISLPAWTEAPGILLMILGGILVAVCVGLFVTRGKGTPAVFDPPRQFVAVGPYRHVRNPLYIAALTLLVGFGLVERSFSILLLSLVWFMLVHLFVVLWEEPDLQARFGATYEDYCKSVFRWIPKL